MKDLDKMYAEKIAAEYAPQEKSKIVALKRLDNKVKMPAYIFTYSFGIVGSLILGTGMSLAMGVIGSNSTGSFILGIIIGLIGILMVSINYPIYKKILNSRKKQYAFEITELTKEIINE